MLTVEGRDVAARANADLEAFFGPGWRARAEARPAAERPAWPATFVGLVTLWASLRILIQQEVQGISKLRANLSRNATRDEYRHGTLQARLATQALLAGTRPILEPPIGDIRLNDLLLELRGLNPAGPATTRRLIRAVELKAKQTRDSTAVWVWIEDAGALPEFPRVDTLAEDLDRVFTAWPHLLGVVLSTLTPQTPDATELFERGVSYTRRLPDARHRHTVVAHRPALPEPRFELIHHLCAEEPAWLDAALPLLQIPGGLPSLLNPAR
ncbi:hypothetical protein [Dactylosporangium salmoneum]|uniref:Transposase n=1 Tax=Dactylosporangium salmoneum TaxID=53361 RepID=A0ABN3GAL0_9ACTN